MVTGRVQITVDQAGQKILRRHATWWRRRGMLYGEVEQAPLGDLWLPLADGTLAQQDVDLVPAMLDVERLAGERLLAGPLEFHGDLVRNNMPYARVPWVEAILGCPVRATIQGGSMRSHPFISDWEQWRALGPRMDEDWLALLLALDERLTARSGGRFAVTQTLMRGPSDLAEAVLGPEMTCLSIYDHPEELGRFLEQVTDVFIHVLQAQAGRVAPVMGGSVNMFGIWAPGTMVRTQCDASAFLSAGQYERWFLPHDVRISKAADYAVIHLHSGCLHVVDPLLAVERPQAIQVSLDPEPSGPPVLSLIPVFRKVLASKPLIVDGVMTPEQVQALREQLPHDGLCIVVRKETLSQDAWRPR
jgi:hypothetical protein